jgi:uncharacterized Zn-binding protein involved in type VI secretion
MPSSALVGVDSAGAVIVGAINKKLTVGGKACAVVGDKVAGHGKSPHSGPVMVQGSSKLTVDGIPVCLRGHLASCGHTATGNNKLTVSG